MTALHRIALLSSLVALFGCPDTTALTDLGAVDADAVICAPADRVCRPDAALVCSDDGTAWLVEACESDETCQAGYCEPPELAILTDVLAPGVVAAAYEELLLSDGGVPPVHWSALDGELPPGLSLHGDGTLSGTPETPGDFVFGVSAIDDVGTFVSRDFSVTVHPEPITIVTPPDLGVVDEGVPMSRLLEATGGVPPYGWFLIDGALPEGIAIDAAGELTGTPLEPGPFDFTLRVVDTQEPPGWGEQGFGLDVELRPLEIIGENVLDIFGFAVVTLPVLTIIPDIPLPYSTQLEATGGLQPYEWAEVDIPSALEFIIPTSGIPDGLVLEPDGLLNGSVTDTSQLITVEIPFTSISLTGFFFFAEVSDSQSSPDTDQALFLIPTIPIGG